MNEVNEFLEQVKGLRRMSSPVNVDSSEQQAECRLLPGDGKQHPRCFKFAAVTVTRENSHFPLSAHFALSWRTNQSQSFDFLYCVLCLPACCCCCCCRTGRRIRGRCRDCLGTTLTMPFLATRATKTL